jgi:hypothetical protein
MICKSRGAATALAICWLSVFAAARPPGASAALATGSGLYRVVFLVPEGKINVNVPNDVATGDTILALVYPAPAGRNQQEVDRNAAALAGYTVESAGSRMVSGGRLRWTIPARLPSGVATIRLRDRKGEVLTQCGVPVTPSGGEVRRPPNTARFVLPLGARAGGAVSLWGSFPEDVVPAIRVGGFAALVIAQSPRRIVFVSPPDAVGATTLEVKFGAGAAVTGPLRILAVQSSATRNELVRGQRATLTVRVSGLQGLTPSAVVVLSNQSPASVALEGGVLQRIAIPAAEIRPDGTWQLTRTLTGEGGGTHVIGVDVTASPTAQMPMEGLVELSVDRWSRRSNVGVTAGARLLIAADVMAARSLLDEFFVAQLAFDADPASLLDSLVRHYCFDLRDRKLRSGGLGGLRLPRIANGFGPQAAGPAVSIEASDVRGYSFFKYLGELLARVTPVQPVGLLVVTSQPDKQQIRIDRSTGSDYFTARSFHITSGDHTVSVGGCREVVKIRTNQQSTVNCARQ